MPFLICFITLSLQAPAGALWQLTKKISDTDLYTSARQTRLTVRASESQANPSKITPRTVKQAQQAKSQVIGRLSFTDWTTEKSHVSTRKGVTRVVLSGTYRDSSDQMTYWREFQYYRTGQKLQMLLTHTDHEALIKDSQPSSIKQIKGQYGF